MKLRIPITWLKRLPAIARVVSVQGQVHAVIAANGQTIPVDSELLLQTGDTLLTGPNSTATLEFGDSSRVLLQAGSELRMEALSAYGQTCFVDTRIRLQQGRVESQVSASIRRWPALRNPDTGRHFGGAGHPLSARHGPSPPRRRGRKYWKALSRSGAAKPPGRSEIAGLAPLAKTGQAPLPPALLLPPPSVAELPPVVTRVPIQWNFPAVKGAVSYRRANRAHRSSSRLCCLTASHRRRLCMGRMCRMAIMWPGCVALTAGGWRDATLSTGSGSMRP